MSSPNTNGGNWGWLLIIIFLVALAMTKPDEAAHRDAIAERTPITRALFGVAELMGRGELEYHDYFFFSTMSARFGKSKMPISYGVLGKVFYGKDK